MCLYSLIFCLTGRKDLRHSIANPNHLHRPTTRQSPSRPLQMYPPMARRLHPSHRLGRRHQSRPRSRPPTHNYLIFLSQPPSTARRNHRCVPTRLHDLWNRTTPNPHLRNVFYASIISTPSYRELQLCVLRSDLTPYTGLYATRYVFPRRSDPRPKTASS